MRDSGIAGSQRFQIKDEVDAWDLDNAVSLRLLYYDNEKESENRKFWVKLVTGETIEDDVLVNESELARNDKWADENTRIM